MNRQKHRLQGLFAAVISALVLIYGAFHYPQLATAGTWNPPLWLGIAGIVLGAVLMVYGSHGTDAA